MTLFSSLYLYECVFQGFLEQRVAAELAVDHVDELIVEGKQVLDELRVICTLLLLLLLFAVWLFFVLRFAFLLALSALLLHSSKALFDLIGAELHIKRENTMIREDVVIGMVVMCGREGMAGQREEGRKGVCIEL